MIICIAEDRPEQLIGVKLLIASLLRVSPEIPVWLCYPPADQEFVTWLREYPNVTLTTAPIADAAGWNVKPTALLNLLRTGHREVWWIDSDVIVERSLAALSCGLGTGTFVACEEASYGAYSDDGYRAMAWGFSVARRLPFCLNSCAIRATQAHIELLEMWRQLLRSSEYLAAQSMPAHSRPFHMLGDQDVLTALLSSNQFQNVRLEVLRRGRHIVQFFGLPGFSLAERLNHLCRPPWFLHCQGQKPWLRPSQAPRVRNFTAYLQYINMEASPYVLSATRLRSQVNDPMHWIAPRSFGGRALRFLGFDHAALTGLPIAVLCETVQQTQRWLGISKKFQPEKAFERLGSGLM